MKKSKHGGQGPQDSGHPAPQQPEKVGWIRKFCGRGIFRELWRTRYVVLRGDHLFISDKEVKDERKAQEVFDLADYERSEELRKAKSRSKKNHSRFTLLRCRQPGNTVPNLVFLAVSPEEKESWVHALNVAIVRAKNRVLDQVTMEDVLVHPTRDRAKIPQGRRLPTRGHLMAVASTSCHGLVTLDLVAEEEGFSSECDSWDNGFRVGSSNQVAAYQVVGGRQRSGTDVSKLRVKTKEPKVKTGSLPRGSERSWGKYSHLEASKVHKSQQLQVLQNQSRTPQPGKKSVVQGRSRCASMDEVLSSRPAMIRSELRSVLRRCPPEEEGGASVQPVGQLQSLIAQRMQRAQELLEEMRLQELQKAKAERERGGSWSLVKSVESPRLHHLRGADSPHSSRSSGSPRSRSSDSPRLRGRECRRSKGRKNRCKGADSSRSRGSSSPAKAIESPCRKASPKPKEGPNMDEAPKLLESPTCVPSPGSIAADWPAESSSLHSGDESSCASQPNSESTSETRDMSRRLSPPPSLLKEEGLERRRAEAERLLVEAMSSWQEAQEVLQEVKELQSQTLRRQRRKTYQKMNSMPTSPEVTHATTVEANVATPDTSPEDESP
ncbi:pleckstrin homology domain-containing family O member 1-A isoform X1 [Entelurus aequoreus]|uniref:pleckstrin homology domain-containing family O member 1-A isoform X1 n=1 Tax=Entelurus aequoreus TaxID=161455 RepID=UPI002B1DBBBB|nr:pleckstrin homology domain-containing family O member 1-A isoform X1 [Entelurus aequoreus]